MESISKSFTILLKLNIVDLIGLLYLQDINNTLSNDPQNKYRLGTSVKYLLEGLNRFHGANLTLSSDVVQTSRCLVSMKDP